MPQCVDHVFHVHRARPFDQHRVARQNRLAEERQGLVDRPTWDRSGQRHPGRSGAVDDVSGELKETLLDFANQERGHKAKLQAVLSGKKLDLVRKDVPDLKISDYLVEVDPSPELSFQGALIIAMKKEKAAYRMYNDMAASCDDAPAARPLSLPRQRGSDAQAELRSPVRRPDLPRELSFGVSVSIELTGANVTRVNVLVYP